MDWKLDHARAEDWLHQQPDQSADLILVDPPYFRVKGEPWDRQWDTAAGFLAWLAGMRDQWQRILKPNGSLYCFASPEMAARVEVTIGERFNVLNRIRWVKEAGWHNKARKEDLRAYLSPWEEIIFAEQQGADDLADDAAGYGLGRHFLHKDVYTPLGRYFTQERECAGLTRNEVEVALGFVSSKDPKRGTALCCRWEEGSSLPTRETYERYRALLCERGPDVYLQRDYRDVRAEYQQLREAYERESGVLAGVRHQFGELRRPFALTDDVSWSDVWTFPAVQPYPGKHPCEKPAALVRHIIATSSRPGALVLDCFAGSGVTGIAARQLGRRFIGCEMSPVWAERAQRRIADAAMQLGLPLAEVAD